MASISVELKESMGTDLTVVNAARVSFNKESTLVQYPIDDNTEEVLLHMGKPAQYDPFDGYPIAYDENGWELTDPELSVADKKLISYLAKHKHKSPFNHCFMSFRVKAPIFVARQLVKHEYLPWNEVSRRYVDDEPEFYIPEKWHKRAENVKQGSSDEEVDTKLAIAYEYEMLLHKITEFYNDMLADGVAPELARIILPQSMMTEWWWSGSLFAFAKMCKLRLDPHAQEESRQVAQLISKEAEKLFPVSWPALLETAE